MNSTYYYKETRPTPPILIIEDNELDLKAAKRAFHKTGIQNEISHAWTGEEAIDYLLNPSNSVPCLILLDLNLPGIGGRKALEILRHEKTLTQTPIIVLTTSDYDKDVEMCYKLGANSYIKKPVDFNSFCSAVNTLVEYWLGTSLLPPQREQRTRIEELEQAKVRAEAASQAKTDFLAVMSHELRTPLNSILGMLRLVLEDNGMVGENREMLGVVQQSASNLLTIVNDLLDISKIESGLLELEYIPFSFGEVLSTIVSGLKPLCNEKGLTLVCNGPDGIVPPLQGDPMHFSRVLINLLGNAIKYTQKGSVKIDITCSEVEFERMLLSVSVTDTGIGIPADKLDHIFEKYAQEDSSITRRFGGTGLGLYITRQLVNRMGGEIGVESEAGKGSRFWFRLPFEKADETPQSLEKGLQAHQSASADKMHKALGELNVLVAEDHLLNQVLMQKILPRLGVTKFKIVGNGHEVLKEFDTGAYDLILMDCHMPELDGYQAVAEIRTKEKAGQKRATPVIAMTADVMPGTRAACLEAGMSEYITKPVDMDELKLMLGRWFHQE